MVDGLLVGMQIFGRRYADGDVLAASATSNAYGYGSRPGGLCRPL
jgi:hypothetical protein